MSRALRAAAVLSFFAALTAVLAWPLSAHPASRALPLSADTRLFLWTLSWDVHALAHRPLHVFDANIFFPERLTLAYSEHLLGSALLGAPLLAATGNPLLALNAVVLLSCVLSGAGAYLLARRVGAGVLGALAAGVVFAFGPPRFVRLAQAHVATVEWIPFCLALLHAYAREGSRRDLLAACGLFTLQALTSGHGGLFLMLAAALLLAYLWSMGAFFPPRKVARDLGLAGALILGVNVVFLLPYALVQREVGLHRTLGAVYDWAPDAASFLAAPTHAQQALLSLLPSLARKVEGARAYLFPGWLTLGLAAAAVLPALRAKGAAADAVTAPRPPAPRWLGALDVAAFAAGAAALAIHVWGGGEWRLAGLTIQARSAARPAVLAAALLVARLALARRAPSVLVRAFRAAAGAFRARAEASVGLNAGYYLPLAALSLWACLGPGYGLYTLLYRLVPGFDLIRVPSRLMILTLLALAVLAGVGLERALARLPGRLRTWAAGAALTLLVAECAAFPLDAPAYTLDVPAVDRWLAGQPKPFTLVALPVADPGDAVRSARLNSLYMLYSMGHWQPMVNGYSGLVPPRHERLFRILTAFPEEASLRELEALGVRYAVLHRDLYGREEWERVTSRAGAFPDRLRLEREEPDGRVYSLLAARTLVSSAPVSSAP